MNAIATHHFAKGDTAIFQSPQYPELAPYPVTIHAVNTSMAGSTHPYYKYKDAAGNVSEWHYHTCFTKPALDEPEYVEALTGGAGAIR